jgi:hypothetical protein
MFHKQSSLPNPSPHILENKMKKLMPALPLLALLAIAPVCHADEKSDCDAAAGTYLTGVVTAAPSFKKASSSKKGIPLSHTHLTLKADQDGKKYDVAIDNVFADGYKKNLKKVPASLATIANGDKLSVCGQPFPGGIHWVHTNCGDTPTKQDPNGWLKKIGDDGQPGDNLEGATTYCYLWPKN